MPRTSSNERATLSLISPAATMTPPEAPAELSSEAREIFDAVVRSRPRQFYSSRELQTMASAYAQHSASMAQLSAAVAKLEVDIDINNLVALAKLSKLLENFLTRQRSPARPALGSGRAKQSGRA